MRRVELRAIKPSKAGDELRRHYPTFFVPDGEDLLFRSWLRDCDDVNEHLHWFYGMLQHQRKLIRRLQEQGLNLAVLVHWDASPIRIRPEALLLAHKLHLPTEIVFEG